MSNKKKKEKLIGASNEPDFMVGVNLLKKKDEAKKLID